MSEPGKKTFGQFFKERRVALRKTLREFCLEHSLDPGNMSKLERSMLPPPESQEKLEQYAQILRLKKGSDEWYTFFDLAAAERGRIPPDLISDAEIAKHLPMFFRSLRGQKGAEQDIQAIMKLLRRS